MIDVAKGLEGLRRQDGIHAAAVVITNEPLTEYLPVQRKPEPGPTRRRPDRHPVRDARRRGARPAEDGLPRPCATSRSSSWPSTSSRQTTGSRPDIDAVPLDDEATFEMLRRGDSIGVFQLEGAAMRSTLRSLAPTSFDDVAALVALYRPGPMAANMHRDYPDLKNGRKPVTYLHPDMEAILGDTYGLMLYQESVMRVAQRFSGYSLEEADNLRKACGKKNRDLIAAEREKFVAGCVTQGYGEALGTQLFDIIEPFADYAFNKSHAYGYGLVAYQTAWLKANYPVEYLAALLSSVKDDKDNTAVYLGECRTLGIEVRVPDVNESSLELHRRSGAATEGAGRGRARSSSGSRRAQRRARRIVEHIVAEREANGPFADFYDFCRRVDPFVLNKRARRVADQGGRLRLARAIPERASASLSNRSSNGRSCAGASRSRGSRPCSPSSTRRPGTRRGASPASFDGTWVAIPDLEFDKAERLAFEKEMLGLYVSDHPLMGLEKALRVTDVTIRDLLDSAAPRGDATAVGAGTGPGAGARTPRSPPAVSSLHS